MTCATSSTRCSTFRTLGASGVSCPTSLVPGRGSGPSFAGGRGTGRGSGFSPHCTRRHAPPLVDKTRSPRWWSSTPISHEEHRTEGTFHNQGSLWSNQRGQANRLRGRHRSATLRESCLPRRAKHGPSNSYSRNSRAWGLTNASNSCSWTAGPRSQPPVDSRNGSAEVRRVGWDEPPRNEHGTKVFRPIRHAWRVEVAHGHLVRRRRLARCFENTVASATGWLHVAAVTEVLRVLG